MGGGGGRCQALECGRARYLPSLIALFNNVFSFESKCLQVSGSYLDHSSLVIVTGNIQYTQNKLPYISSSMASSGGRLSPAVACWASDHWVASSNPLRASFVINFASLSPASAWPSLA